MQTIVSLIPDGKAAGQNGFARAAGVEKPYSGFLVPETHEGLKITRASGRAGGTFCALDGKIPQATLVKLTSDGNPFWACVSVN